MGRAAREGVRACPRLVHQIETTWTSHFAGLLRGVQPVSPASAPIVAAALYNSARFLAVTATAAAGQPRRREPGRRLARSKRRRRRTNRVPTSRWRLLTSATGYRCKALARIACEESRDTVTKQYPMHSTNGVKIEDSPFTGGCATVVFRDLGHLRSQPRWSRTTQHVPYSPPSADKRQRRPHSARTAARRLLQCH